MAASPERLMVDFLRADSGVAGIVGTRIATTLPNTPTLPFVTVRLIGGGPEDGEAPIDLYLLEVNAWAATRAEADVLFRALVDALREHTNYRSAQGHLRPAGVSNVRRADDTDAVDRYRYTVDAFAQMSA